jgi:hypothetical protein
MTYQVKVETQIGELEAYGPVFTNKAKAVRLARLAARTTAMQDVTRFHVDCVETECAVFTVNARRNQ